MASGVSSRTAALSRYLTALDSPPPAKSISNDIKSGQRDPNKFETNFLETGLALWNDNKEEANGDVHRRSASRNEHTVNFRRHRSHSAGRVPTNSQNIVQDVYDRLGVSRGEPSGAAIIPSDTASTERCQEKTSPDRGRSRNSPSNTEGQRRARSLSRGRSVAGRWPPTEAQAATSAYDDSDDVPLAPKELTRVVSDTDPDISGIQQGSSSHSKSLRQSAPKNYTHRSPSEDSFLRVNRSLDYSAPNSKKGSPYKTSNGISGSSSYSFEERLSLEDSNGNMTNDETMHSTSVRDRVSALSKKSNRNFQQRSYPIQYAKRDYPPPIDLYAGSQRQDYRNDDNEESNSLENSTALSSMSADEFQQDRSFNVVGSRVVSSRPSIVVGRRWTPNNKIMTKTITSPSSKSGNSVSSTQDLVEQIVQERLKAHAAEMEARMEVQMMHVERRLEERMKIRIDSLEDKIIKIGELVTSIVTGGTMD